jgi:hypothetical protein
VKGAWGSWLLYGVVDKRRVYVLISKYGSDGSYVASKGISL